jgi:hypothetical protein
VDAFSLTMSIEWCVQQLKAHPIAHTSNRLGVPHVFGAQISFGLEKLFLILKENIQEILSRFDTNYIVVASFSKMMIFG